jgi:hypothetical protein
MKAFDVPTPEEYRNLKVTEINMRRGSGTSVKIRDESTCVITHLYMKAMLGIFLYSSP